MNRAREETKRHGWVERLARLQPWYVLSRYEGAATRAVFTFLGGFLAIVLLGAAAIAADWPLLLPSLGPSAFLVFWKPSVPESSPRNILLAHTLGVLAGGGALLLTGHDLTLDESGGTSSRVVAAGLALALAAALMILTHGVHPPGAATALFVALGMTSTVNLFMLFTAAIGLCVIAWTMNRIAGVYYPLWKCRPVETRDGVAVRALLVDERSDEDPGQDRDWSRLAADLTGRRRGQRRRR